MLTVGNCKFIEAKKRKETQLKFSLQLNKHKKRVMTAAPSESSTTGALITANEFNVSRFNALVRSLKNDFLERGKNDVVGKILRNRSELFSKCLLGCQELRQTILLSIVIKDKESPHF